MARVEPMHLFSLPLFTAVLDGLLDRREALVERILDLETKSPSLVASNQHGWHSARNLHAIGDADLAWLGRAVLDQARSLVTRDGGSPSKLVLSDLWAMVLRAGGWAAPHHHFPYPWSGVIYLSANASVGEDRSDRAGKLELENPIPMAERFGQPSGMVITPRDALLVLFPGALRHFVHPVRSAGPRVSVSFNLSITE